MRFLKNLFSKGSCKECGWLVACPECSEKMRIADTKLKHIERSRALRKEPRYRHRGKTCKGLYDGTVDKESFVEVLKQMLVECHQDGGTSLMLIISADEGFSSADAQQKEHLRAAVAQRLVSQVRHEDFVTLFDDRTFALLLIDNGEAPLVRDAVVKRFEEELKHPYQAGGRSVYLPMIVRRIMLDSSTSLEDIVRQMDS